MEIKINTGNETKTETVDQSEDGGHWVPIGRYELEKGERNVVEISAGSGDEKVFADAVAVVRGVNDFPAEPKKIGDNSETEASGETMFSAAGSKRIPRRALMRRAKSFLGTPYRYSTRCSWGMRTLDCSCFTRHVYKKWCKIPDHPGCQWYGVKKMSTKFGRKSRLKRGDLTFFDSNRNGNMRDNHDTVAIYAGNGNIIMASSYYGKVTWVKMKYLKGFKDGKRLRYR